METIIGELRNRINDLYGALITEVLKCRNCPIRVAAAAKKNGSQNTTREASSCSIAVRNATRGKRPSIGQKS
jgi:hypothetical protein